MNCSKMGETTDFYITQYQHRENVHFMLGVKGLC